MKLKVDYSTVPGIEIGNSVLLAHSGPMITVYDEQSTQIGELSSPTVETQIQGWETVMRVKGWYRPNEDNLRFWALGEITLR
jgi:hypothetical protein